MPANPPLEHPIILFDGVCHLCTAAVQFILQRDPSGRFHFASLQSATGRQLLQQHGLDPTALSTFVLIESQHAYTKSTAALRLTRRLKFPWPLLSLLGMIPPCLRDPVYDLVAKNRYQWFGKSETCLMPHPAWQDRFL